MAKTMPISCEHTALLLFLCIVAKIALSNHNVTTYDLGMSLKLKSKRTKLLKLQQIGSTVKANSKTLKASLEEVMTSSMETSFRTRCSKFRSASSARKGAAGHTRIRFRFQTKFEKSRIQYVISNTV